VDVAEDRRSSTGTRVLVGIAGGERGGGGLRGRGDDEALGLEWNESRRTVVIGGTNVLV
jgi:hypothetical protein